MKVIFFPKIKSVLPMTVIAEWSPCPYLNPRAFCYILSACPAEKGSDKAASVGTWLQPGLIHHIRFTPGDHAKAQTSISKSIGQAKIWVPYFISARGNLQLIFFPSFFRSKAEVSTAKGVGIYCKPNKNWVAKGRLTAARLLSPTIGDLIIHWLLSTLCL